MRYWLRFGACLIAAGLTFLAPGHATAQEPIRIGVLLPLTGPFAKNGIENWEAMQIARDMINERGGVNGRKIEFVNGDATSPAAAISETERLITKEGIKITTGSFASPLAIAVSQAAERHGVFHWETAGAADIITKRGFKYTFQVGSCCLSLRSGRCRFQNDAGAHQETEQTDWRAPHRTACGKIVPSESRSATAFAAMLKKRTLSSFTMRDMTSSPRI